MINNRMISRGQPSSTGGMCIIDPSNLNGTATGSIYTANKWVGGGDVIDN